MTKFLPLILLLALGPAPSRIETRVLNAIQDMLRQGTAISFSGRSSAGAATVDGHCRIRVQPADVSAQIDDAAGYMTVEGL